MNTPSSPSELRLLTLLHKVRDEQDAQARSELNALLITDAAARREMASALVNEQALISTLRDQSIVSILNPEPASRTPTTKSPRWYSWRPLTAAAAGIVFGMLCTSVVFGYVSQQLAVQMTALQVFDAGLENGAPLDQGVPPHPGRWGADSARVVMAENGVRPVEGQRMLRLDPIPREKDVKNHASRVYQVIDLHQAAPLAVNTEVQVVGSFCASKGEMTSRFMIRAVAFDEAPEQAMKDFWPKAQSDEAVSMSQRFETPAGDQDWHAFSLKMPLPPGSQTLVIVLASSAPEEESLQATVSYLDDVQVSLITPLPVQP